MKPKEVEALFKLAFRAGYDQARVEEIGRQERSAAAKRNFRLGQIAEAERIGDRKRALDLQGGKDE